jgi:Phosphotransferase enzyme family
MVNHIQKSDNTTGALPLPLRPGEVTPQWLEAALRERDPGLRLGAAEVVDVLPGTSTKIRVAVRPAAGGKDLPATLIVKGGFEDHSAAMGPMYFNEMRFYRDVQPHVAIHSPRCFYAGVDPSSHQSIVIMEDLVTRGVRFCHPLRPQSPAQITRRLSAIARYHAATWNSEAFAPGGRFDWIGGRHEGWSVTYQQHYLEPQRWQHYMAQPRGAAVAAKLRDRDWMQHALAALGACHRDWPVCLCHGDTHLGNLYEEADGTPGFFDAQVARGPWQLEVTYHLIGALDVGERRAHEQALLQHYLDELQSHGVTPPAFNEAWEAHKREVAYGLFIFLINETRFQTEAINTAYTARFGAAALDHDTHGLLARA